MTTKDRRAILANFLEMDRDDLTDEGGNRFSIQSGSKEYLVLTDEEATQAAREYIRERLWAFNTRFVLGHSKVDSNGKPHFDRMCEAVAEMQETLCEDANEIVFALIEDFDAFVADAIRADGRGHFLSQYDGNEWERSADGVRFYIYRT